MKKNLILLLSVSTLLFSCDSDSDDAKTFSGDTQQVYDGHVTNWIKTENNYPIELGITFDQETLNTLPSTGEQENSFILHIAPKAKQLTTIDHIELGWNPTGHPPLGIYDLPHFDFHYYMVTEEEVANTMEEATMEIAPAADYLPANFIPGPSIPMMGKHWLDSTSPELNGGVFTQTFTYGSNNGEVTFYEPMITKLFLTTTASFEREIPVPAKVSRTGNYPTKMRIEKKNGKVSVILSHFVNRVAS